MTSLYALSVGMIVFLPAFAALWCWIGHCHGTRAERPQKRPEAPAEAGKGERCGDTASAAGEALERDPVYEYLSDPRAFALGGAPQAAAIWMPSAGVEGWLTTDAGRVRARWHSLGSRAWVYVDPGPQARGG